MQKWCIPGPNIAAAIPLNRGRGMTDRGSIGNFPQYDYAETPGDSVTPEYVVRAHPLLEETNAVVERILIVDPDETLRETLELTAANLPESKFEFKRVATAAQAFAYLERVDADAVLCSNEIPGLDDFDIVPQLIDRLVEGCVILTGEQSSGLLASEARSRGAFDCLSKPIGASEFLFALTRVRDHTRQRRKQITLSLQLERADDERIIVAASDRMIEVLEVLERAAEFDSPALISGEIGTRKHLIAHAIHAQSARRGGPFIAVGCTRSSTEPNLKKELFGTSPDHSGRRRATHRGLMTLAEGGTLFLDQVDQLSGEVQLRILRVIEENELWSVGEGKARPVDVRVIAASSQNLAELVAKGSFDESLYARLASIEIALPPLRDRKKDIPLLIDQFLVHFRKTLGKDVSHLSDEALERLCKYEWPGNVRELQNTVERAVILADSEGVSLGHLPKEIVEDYRGTLSECGEDFALKPARMSFEAMIIKRALKAAGGNRTQASTLLGISHRSLLYKLKAFGIRD